MGAQCCGALRLPSKCGRRSGPCQIMALREQPVKFYGPPGPLLTTPVWGPQLAAPARAAREIAAARTGPLQHPGGVGHPGLSQLLGDICRGEISHLPQSYCTYTVTTVPRPTLRPLLLSIMRTPLHIHCSALWSAHPVLQYAACYAREPTAAPTAHSRTPVSTRIAVCIWPHPRLRCAQSHPQTPGINSAR